MKRKTVCLFFLFIQQMVFGQVNLVSNGDFEDYKWLPTKFSGIYIDSIIPGWNSPTNGTPDYFYFKDPKVLYDELGFPVNWRLRNKGVNKYEYVKALNGKAFCGLEFGVNKKKEYNWNIIGTEFLQTKFLQPLKNNCKYHLIIHYRCSKITNSVFGQLGYTFTQKELYNKYATFDINNPYHGRFNPPVVNYTSFSRNNYDSIWHMFDTIITFNEPKNYLTIGGFNMEFHPYTTDTHARFYFFVDNISLHELPVIHGPDTVCINETVKLYSSFSGPVEWWFNGNLVSKDSAYNFTAIHSGIYYLKTPNDKVSHHLTVVQNNIHEESRVYEICEGENIKVDISDKYTAEWSDGIISNHRIFIDQTRLSVTISDKFCKKDIDIIIDKKPLQKFQAPDRLDFCAYNDINYSEVELPNDFVYHWQDTLPCFYRKFTAPGKYVFSFIDTNFCNRKDSIIVSDLCDFIVWLPNAIAPNGINKDFRPYLEYIERATLVIYNRWGEKIFEESSLSPVWDGYYQGRPCQQGVYFYKLEIEIKKSGTMKFVSGVVHLLE